MGEYMRAIEDFDRALALKPTLDWVVSSRNIAFASLKRPGHIVHDADQSPKMDSPTDWTYGQRGAGGTSPGPEDDDEPSESGPWF